MKNETVKIITLGTGHGDPTRCRFHSSTLLEINHSFYLLDAGSPVTALMIRKGVDLSGLKAVFVSHMHLDHFGGLPDLVKYQRKHDFPLRVFLPEEDAPEKMEQYYTLTHRDDAPGGIQYSIVAPGIFFRDGNLEATAIPTGHFRSPGKGYPSFAFLIKSSGLSILYTGDLSGDFSDFPLTAALETDVCICELTHYNPDDHLDVFRKLRLKKLIFTHIGNAYHAPDAPRRFAGLADSLPYPAVMASDGDEFIF